MGVRHRRADAQSGGAGVDLRGGGGKLPDPLRDERSRGVSHPPDPLWDIWAEKKRKSETAARVWGGREGWGDGADLEVVRAG